MLKDPDLVLTAIKNAKEVPLKKIQVSPLKKVEIHSSRQGIIPVSHYLMPNLNPITT